MYTTLREFVYSVTTAIFAGLRSTNSLPRRSEIKPHSAIGSRTEHASAHHSVCILLIFFECR